MKSLFADSLVARVTGSNTYDEIKKEQRTVYSDQRHGYVHHGGLNGRDGERL